MRANRRTIRFDVDVTDSRPRSQQRDERSVGAYVVLDVRSEFIRDRERLKIDDKVWLLFLGVIITT